MTKLAVVIPCYNEEEMLEHSIKRMFEVFDDLIRITPKLLPQENAKSHIGLRIQNGIPNGDNNEFRLVHFDFEVFTPMTQWMIANSNLRPFAIMGEIENSLKGKRVKLYFCSLQ